MVDTKAQAKKATTPAPQKTATPTAATAPAAPKRERKAPVALDFNAMQVQNVAKNAVKHSRGSHLDGTPVMGWLTESYENDQAKSVAVPSEEAADQLHALLRSGAARLEIGVKVVITKSSEHAGWDVQFLAKEKREYQKRNKATA